ncbi:c-type cytochrome [Candidatus Methylomirabilis sp.]|uniref:c-type cytochrome n=1 Tax=Candidatus Methylomirabilis sp. TaxID=2032687 RepID=UPI003C720CCF
MERSETLRIMGREVRRKARTARLQWHSLLTSGVLLRGAVLTCSLLLVSVLNGWSDESPKGGGHHRHRLVGPPPEFLQQREPVKQQPRLAISPRWRFAIPTGDHHAGRQVFVDFECFKCHEVLGEDFPASEAEQGDVGSVLSGMGAMHPAEYFAEVMIDPNASVAWRIRHHKAEKKGYLGPDGTSKMPSYNDSMTVQQLIDLVAYMKSLTSGVHTH